MNRYSNKNNNKNPPQNNNNKNPQKLTRPKLSVAALKKMSDNWGEDDTEVVSIVGFFRELLSLLSWHFCFHVFSFVKLGNRQSFWRQHL